MGTAEGLMNSRYVLELSGLISKHNPSHYTCVMDCRMQTDVSIKLAPQIYKLLTSMDPNAISLQKHIYSPS